MNLFFRQENVNTVTVTPTSGAVLFRKDSSQALNNPSRPSSLQVNNSPVNSPPSSSPIPVPTQVAAYKRMCSSPSSPQTTCKQIVGSSGQLVKKVCRFELFYTHNFLHWFVRFLQNIHPHDSCDYLYCFSCRINWVSDFRLDFNIFGRYKEILMLKWNLKVSISDFQIDQHAVYINIAANTFSCS